MNREYHQWWSERLRRNMELLVFGHAGAKVLVFPSRLGRFVHLGQVWPMQRRHFSALPWHA